MTIREALLAADKQQVWLNPSVGESGELFSSSLLAAALIQRLKFDFLEREAIVAKMHDGYCIETYRDSARERRKYGDTYWIARITAA